MHGRAARNRHAHHRLRHGHHRLTGHGLGDCHRRRLAGHRLGDGDRRLLLLAGHGLGDRDRRLHICMYVSNKAEVTAKSR